MLRENFVRKTCKQAEEAPVYGLLSMPLVIFITLGHTYIYCPPDVKLDTVIFQDLNIQASTENPYGQVREGGWIRLQVPLLELEKSKLLEGLYARVRGLSTLTKFAHLQEVDGSGLEAQSYVDISPQHSETLSAVFLISKILGEDRDAEGNVSTKSQNWRHIYGLAIKKSASL